MDIVSLALAYIATQTGIAPATLVLWLGLLVSAANVTSRLIPDDAVGWLGVMRKIAKIIGMYVSNRVTSGVTANDILRGAIDSGVKGLSREEFMETPPEPNPPAGWPMQSGQDK